MSGNLRSFPPTRAELREFCYDVLSKCETCSKEPYQLSETSGFAPCEACAMIIDTTLLEFNRKLYQIIPVVKACDVCRPKIDAELAKGSDAQSAQLCEACSEVVGAIYREGLN